MKATEGRLYALIQAGIVHTIFTSDDLPEWNDSLVVVDISDVVPKPDVFWLAEFSADAWVFSPPPAPTPAQIVAQYESALDSHLDGVAKLRRYDNRFTFALRAGYPGPYHDEAVAFAEWMDSCNVQAFALLQSVKNGEAEMPTIENFISGLPAFAP